MKLEALVVCRIWWYHLLVNDEQGSCFPLTGRRRRSTGVSIEPTTFCWQMGTLQGLSVEVMCFATMVEWTRPRYGFLVMAERKIYIQNCYISIVGR